MLSLQSSEVGLSGSLLSSSSFSLLNSLSSKELLFHLLGFKFLCGLFFLQLFELGSPGLGQFFLVFSLLLGVANLGLELLVLFDLKLSLLLLLLELLQQLLLLLSLLRFEGLQGLGVGGLLGKGLSLTFESLSLSAGFFGSFFKGLLHGGELLHFRGISWFLNSFH
jgi:hypothetical protein